LFASAGYALHPADLKTPLGTPVKDAQVQTMKLQGGVAIEYTFAGVPERAWSVQTRLGAGRLNSVQTAATAFANQTNNLVFASAGVFIQRPIWRRFHGFIGYEHRRILERSNPNADVAPHNGLLGMMGNFE
jgi:hypothetical protein